MCRLGDVLLSRRGDIGRCVLIREADAGVLCGTGSLRVTVQGTELDSQFLFYYLSTSLGRAELQGRAVGSTMPNINTEIVRSVSVPLPPLLTQRKIAAILCGYDDLIENNNRRINLLEEMIQGIYREWFVEFRYPGHEGVSLVDSEFGPTPRGWSVQPLTDVLEFYVGGGWGKDAPDDIHTEPAFVIRGTDFARATRLDFASCSTRFHTNSNLASRLLRPGDLILEVSGGSTDQPVGRSMLFSKQHAATIRGQVICASFCKLLRLKRNVLTPELLYLHFWDLYETRRIETYQVQSTGIKNLRFAQLLEGDLLVTAPRGLQAQFAALVTPMFEASRSIARVNGILRASRDLLLPRLVSEEVDVGDLNIEVTNAA